MTTGPSLIAINVGNSRTQIGRFINGRLEESARIPDNDTVGIAAKINQWWQSVADKPQAAIALASVNDPAADQIVSALEDRLSVEVYRVGRDLPVPIGRQLDPETITGVDRLLNAAAAYDIVQQACIIVDAGSAVTVDFVDGEGTFHGGAIAPGASVQLRSLHEHTAALPEVEFRPPGSDAIGHSTAQAMLSGVFHGICGLVWRLVERYAEQYGAYPMVIATGGDAEALFEHDELIDRHVPDLTLLGIAAAARHALAEDRSEQADESARS
ncbi:MAG: type III pantothenate kinase [Phycisphaerales bacterium]|nr:MAG: type III pantothenate kinase [Phycisphaerales bacterium]